LEIFMAKTRLDTLLVEQGYFESREKAKAVIMSGEVFVNGQRADKPGTTYPDDAQIEVRGGTLKYVSRGGLKLEKALDFFGGSPEGKVCMDCGASTGGFTDCMLQRGATHVYSIDVGYGQLAWSIRNDERVTVMERTNVRYITPDMFPERPSLATIDVSFISLSLILPAVHDVLLPGGEVFCLIKPQFEAGKEKVGKKGVVREKETHLEVLRNFITNAETAGFSVRGITWSPIKGPEGNIEFLGSLKSADLPSQEIDLEAIVDEVHSKL
jgi:23S rRNA (cytidine1920-2'-O)/16S rRNA (cytidine1409-2'-O)-methyltransferase